MKSSPPVQVDLRARTIAKYLGTLPNPRPNGTFPGGLVFQISSEHLVGILLPPVGRAYDEFAAWLQRGLSDPAAWELSQQEEMPSEDGHIIEAVHIVRI